MNTKKQGKAKMLISLSKGYRWLFFVAALTTILGIIFNYLMPQVIMITIDSVIGEEPFNLPSFIINWIEMAGGREYFRSNLIVCAIIGILFSLLSGISTFFSRMAMAKSSEGIIRKMRNKLYSHTQRLPYSWHVKHPTGDVIQRCTSDIDVIKGFLSGQLLEMIRIVFLITISLILMFSMNVKLSIVALCFIPLVLGYSGIFYSKISKKFKATDEAEGALSAMAQENFTGVRVVRAFGRQSHEIDRFKKKNNYFASLWIKLGYLLSVYWGIGDLVSNLQVMSIIGLGIIEAVNGNITVGQYMLFIVYNSMLVWPVRSLGRILSEMSKTGVSLTRVSEILYATQEHDTPNSVTPNMKGDIVFDNVTFDYNGLKPVLKNISFKVKAGTTFGILGGTGSGKSTLMYLIDRLYDLPENSGKITINGVDIKNIKLDHLRKNVGFVLQEPFLFSKTIKENIGISEESEDIQKIRYSAKVAAIDDSIAEFSQGYDTIVGERGVTLSGGQKQRIAIARMLMQKTPIMIFDDSLSAVDTETDAKIRSSLKANTGNSTVILISHRITTLMHADQIIVLDDGQISQVGTHKELSTEDGIYKQIYEIQGTIENEINEITQLGGDV